MFQFFQVDEHDMPAMTDAWGHSAESYRIQMIGEGLSFQDRIFQIVHRPNCNMYLEVGSLEAHRQGHHGVARGDLK